MTRPLFDQYKDALRRGHLAARANKVDDALAAYAEAARIAPDRAAPHTSSATVLHRAGRHDQSLTAFERALAIAPDDEATLRARAAAFRDLGRLASAAADLERLAEALDADGRVAEGLAAAREAVSYTATSGRRALVARLEAIDPETAPRPRLSPVERATASKPVPTEAPKPSSTLLDLYDEPIEPIEPVQPADQPAAMSARERGDVPAPAPSDEGDAADPDRDSPADPVPAPDRASLPARPKAPIGFTPEPSFAAPIVEGDWNAPARRSSFDLAPGLQSDALVQLEEDDAGASIPWPAIDLPSAPPPPIVGPPPDPEILMAEALALVDSGDPKAARNLMLTAVMVHRAAGRPDAALDVCLQLLVLAPGDAHVHLAIAGLQLDRGWRGLATDKIQLLLRLTALTGDTQAEADAHALAAERLRDELPSSFARA